MAGPLNGVGAQQQVPISNTFKPGGSQSEVQVREREDAQPKENTVQAQGAAAAESRGTESNNQDILKARIAEAVGAADSGSQTDQPRGSLLDIQV